ncbi:type II secretion system protein GspN [Desulfococcus sp.]|uniref:type II secretion system protein GspN n=1 Tax=Desulfococcus sp. TaxID=2025834 RepID=UPI003592F9AC
MTRIPKKWLFYSLYTLAVASCFLYYLFPSEAIEAYLTAAIQKQRPSATLTIGRVAPAFPPGVKASPVSYSEGGPLELALEYVKIMPEIRTAFGASPAFSVRGEGYEGRMTGRITLDSNRTLSSLHADLADIQMKAMAALQRLSGRNIAGTLSGTIDYEKADGGTRLTADLSASRFRVDLGIPGVNLKELTFSEANAKLAAGGGTALRIESLTAKGSQVNGDLSGTIQIRAPFEKSVLDMTGSVRPHPSFISDLGSPLAALFQNRGGNNSFPFAVKGTIEAPEFLLR